MESFNVTELLQKFAGTEVAYKEFLRKESMSVGLYQLPAQSADPQNPHNEDELYFVLSGRGQVLVGEENGAVSAGDLIFVGKGVVHRFHAITETLNVLVFFAPAESDK